MRKSTWVLIFLIFLLAIVLYEPQDKDASNPNEDGVWLSENNETPLVVWYVVAKRLGPDFLDKAKKAIGD